MSIIGATTISHDSSFIMRLFYVKIIEAADDKYW